MNEQIAEYIISSIVALIIVAIVTILIVFCVNGCMAILRIINKDNLIKKDEIINKLTNNSYFEMDRCFAEKALKISTIQDKNEKKLHALTV